MDQSLLVLIVTPTMENTLVDWLLDNEDIPGFASMPINGHGASAHSLSTAEQVAGRKRHIMFQICLPSATAQTVIDALHQTFAGSALHYWQIPVLAAGHLN